MYRRIIFRGLLLPMFFCITACTAVIATPAVFSTIVATLPVVPTVGELTESAKIVAMPTLLTTTSTDSQVPLSVSDKVSPVNTANSDTVNGASVSVNQFTYDEQSASVSYCLAIAGLTDWRSLREYHSWPEAPKLMVDQVPAPFLAGGSDYAKGNGCAYMQYQVGAAQIEQAQQVSFVINNIRMDLPPGDPDAACQAVRLSLLAQYPGLDFQCHFSMAGSYTDLQLPAGMTNDQADQLIMDTIQGALYGPWIVRLK